jgi:hypothetical protein
MPKKLEYITGQTFQTNEGYKVVVIEYFTSSNCTIQFENGYIKEHIPIDYLRKGEVSNPFHKSLYEKGFLGVGKYVKSTTLGHSDTYKVWKGLFRRCYSKNPKDVNPTYEGVTVCEEWHNFQNFAGWYEENWKPHMQGWHLDKDVLVKGNKIYSPETCCFVPQEINNLFTKVNSKRGLYPIGVSLSKSKLKYTSYIIILGKTKNIGTFDTIEEAFQTYKTTKESYIKEIADKYKEEISDTVYNAMYNYQVEITD